MIRVGRNQEKNEGASPRNKINYNGPSPGKNIKEAVMGQKSEDLRRDDKGTGHGAMRAE